MAVDRAFLGRLESGILEREFNLRLSLILDRIVLLRESGDTGGED